MAKLPKLDLSVPIQKVGNILRVPISDVDINDDYNARRYHTVNIDGMVSQLIEDGRQFHPILCRRRPGDLSRLTVLMGFRRAKGLKQISDNGLVADDHPLYYATVEDLGEMSDEEAFKFNVSENVRENLSVIDIAYALDMAVTMYGMKAKDAVRPYGKSAGWASQIMSLLRLPEDIKKKIHEGKINQSTGLELVSYLDNPEEFAAALERLKSTGAVTRSDVRDAVRDHQLSQQEAAASNIYKSTGDPGTTSPTSTPVGENVDPGEQPESTPPPPKATKTALTLKQVNTLIDDRIAWLEKSTSDDFKYSGDQHAVLSILQKMILGRLSSAAGWKKIGDILPHNPRAEK